MKILGLDLGTASIGWALIECNDELNGNNLLGLGSRIIQYENKEESDFTAGRGETACAKRTAMRTARKLLDRYQLRRASLRENLIELGMMKDNEKFPSLSPVEVWKLRSDAASSGNKLSLADIARVLLHLNQKRGYKHAKSDLNDSKQTEYVQKVNSRFAEIKELGLTAGQYFYRKLKESEEITAKGNKFYTYRIKNNVLPRVAYTEEFDQIMSSQRGFYPEILTEGNINNLKQAIFFQRPLKSCKHLVSFCEFERKLFKDLNGKEVESGPKVAPRTSPLAQVCKIYESINNIRLYNPRHKEQKNLFDDISDGPRDAKKLGYEYEMNKEERERVFDYLNTNEKLTETKLLSILGLQKSNGFKSDKALGKGIQGNITYCKIAAALEGYDRKDELLRFELKELDTELVDADTGEIIMKVSDEYREEPLYKLWHTLYSISDKKELFHCLKSKFGIDNESVLEKLYAIDLVSPGYSNKSAKFMRKLIPNLRRGYKYSEACTRVNVNHSDSLTKEENNKRILKSRLDILPKGTLRQPIVEKIINQTINLVNAILDEYGEIDEVRVELARELKMSREERTEISNRNNKQERENNKLSERIAEMGIIPSRRRIQKMRMLQETGNKCVYCGKTVTPTQFIEGHGYEIEHIIPRSRLFDDSFSNKVCSCRECNQAKGALTAYDFMKGRSEQDFNSYCDRVENLYKDNKISRTKRNKLMMEAKDIPQDFIERDLRESQYIAKKTREVLREAIRNVHASSGAVTSYFRHVWGYDNILHDINFQKYKDAGQIESVKYESHGQIHHRDRIKNWSKRKDHRHHALDALVIALTRQGYIQRLNTLNASSEEEGGKDNLDKWAAKQPHFSVEEVCKALDNVSVSFKAGKKLTTPGKRCVKRNGKRVCVQTGILVPRGPLTKESVYGEILVYDGKKSIKQALKIIDLVVNPEIRDMLKMRLEQYGGDESKVLKSLKKDPMKVGGKEVSDIGCYRREIVMNYDLSTFNKLKEAESIVDPRIRKIVKDRFKEVGEKDFAKSLVESPLYSDKNVEIKRVRCFTGISAESLACVRHDSDGNPIGYSQTRNNHHVALYRNPDGSIEESIVSFWDCILRKRYGLPIIITNPSDAWDKISCMEDNEDIQRLANGFPPVDSELYMTLRRNEMFVLGMSDDEWHDAVESGNVSEINRHLYRVWKLSSNNYCFKFHTDTTAKIEDGDKEMKQYYNVRSINAFSELYPRKVTVTMLGNLRFN